MAGAILVVVDACEPERTALYGASRSAVAGQLRRSRAD
jgi:hypothetical protein